MVKYRLPEDWKQWVSGLSEALHARNRWRFALIIVGILFARGRRTITSWLRAVGITDNFSDYYCSVELGMSPSNHYSAGSLPAPLC